MNVRYVLGETCKWSHSHAIPFRYVDVFVVGMADPAAQHQVLELPEEAAIKLVSSMNENQS